VRGVAMLFLAAGLLALGYAAWVVLDARAYQAMAERRFERERRNPAVAPVAVEGAVVGEVRIARLGLTAVVVQGDSAAILRRAVGHLAGSALPGQPGNVVLAGHRDTFFRPLARVRVGDVIALRTSTGDFEYRVESTNVVPPSRVQVLEPTAGRTLTLVTCYPFGYLGAAPDRFIVRALETASERWPGASGQRR
jgi:sortase A